MNHMGCGCKSNQNGQKTQQQIQQQQAQQKEVQNAVKETIAKYYQKNK